MRRRREGPPTSGGSLSHNVGDGLPAVFGEAQLPGSLPAPHHPFVQPQHLAVRATTVSHALSHAALLLLNVCSGLYPLLVPMHQALIASTV